MSRYRTTTGFVVGRQNFGEADRILKLFTQEDGRIDVVARGIRKPQAKLASRTEPFCEIEWRLVEGRGLPVVIGAEVHTSHRPQALTDVSLGWSLLELTGRTFPENEACLTWYNFLQTTFGGTLTTQPAVIWFVALVKSLDQLGLNPALPSRPDHAHVLHLADGQWSEGGSGTPVSAEAIQLWQAARIWPLEQVLKVKHAALIAEENSQIIEEFWNYHTGHQLQSRLY